MNRNSLLKFVTGSAIGVLMFLIPVKTGDSVNIIVGIAAHHIKDTLSVLLPFIVLFFVLSAAIITTLVKILRPEKLLKNKFLKETFDVSPLYFISRILGAIFVTLVVFKIGPEWIISKNTGGTILLLCMEILPLILALCYFLPFLTDYGAMEFVGTLIRPVIRFFFKVPGRGAIDLLSSWFGSGPVGVIITARQYDAGFYNAREASVIAVNFSIVSIPMCLVVAKTLALDHMFPLFYLSTIVLGFILGVITPRVYPLNKIPDTYNDITGQKIYETVPKNHTLRAWALQKASEKAESMRLKDVFRIGNEIFFGIQFSLPALVFSWGTIALIVVEYTPLFQWISYPFGYYLHLFGVAESFENAPSALAGFADMFLPAILSAKTESEATKFIIGVLSLIQIVYMTEIGALILQSNIPLKFKDLLVIFLIRTIIAIPIIVLIARFIF